MDPDDVSSPPGARAADAAARSWIAGRLGGDEDLAGDVVARLRSRGLLVDADPWAGGPGPAPSETRARTFTDRLVDLGLALDLLYGLVAGEDQPCRLDHNGDCQEHGWFGDGECITRRARLFLGTHGRLNPPTGPRPAAELALELLRRIANDRFDNCILTELIGDDGGGHFLIDSSWINCSPDEMELLRRLTAHHRGDV